VSDGTRDFLVPALASATRFGVFVYEYSSPRERIVSLQVCIVSFCREAGKKYKIIRAKLTILSLGDEY
jgi:hypothetical protein